MMRSFLASAESDARLRELALARWGTISRTGKPFATA
jgi:hypothetical protein